MNGIEILALWFGLTVFAGVVIGGAVLIGETFFGTGNDNARQIKELEDSLKV